MVSTLGMCKKVVRILARFLAPMLASILLLAAAIRVDQYVLRYRAEHSALRHRAPRTTVEDRRFSAA